MANVQENQDTQEVEAPAGQRGGSQGNSDSESQKKAPDPQRKRTIRFVLLALLVVALIVAIPIYAYYSVRENTDDAEVDGHVIPISARVNGTVLEVLVNDNQLVKAGQPLIKLDPADYQVAVAQAEAQLASAEANTTESNVNVPLTNINTRSQVSTSATQVDEAQANLAAAQQAVNSARARITQSNANLAGEQADLLKAQKDLVRYQDLVSKDEISKQDYDAALASQQSAAAKVDAGKADVTSSQHALDQALAQVNVAKARLATAMVQRRQSEETRPRQQEVTAAREKQSEAMVKQAQANLNQAKLNAGYTVIVAPVDGVVSRKTAEPGMQLSQGQQIMALVPLDDIWVTANFKETQLKKMAKGQKVDIEVDTYGSSRKYHGHIDSIAAASGAKFALLPPENATGNYVKVVQRVPVKILLEPGENRDHSLLPGMSVTPIVLLNSGANNN
jgi:membrane fusion protein (multidrug efflux system)